MRGHIDAQDARDERRVELAEDRREYPEQDWVSYEAHLDAAQDRYERLLGWTHD